jgi:hypothetical protein
VEGIGWRVVQVSALVLSIVALGVAVLGDDEPAPAAATDGSPAADQTSAGGSFQPGLATIAAGGEAVQPRVTLDDGAQEVSGLPESSGAWTRVGDEVFVNARYRFARIEPGSGFFVLDCLPVVPVNAPRIIGDGFLVHGTGVGALKQDVQVVLDPVFDTARPVLFVDRTVAGGQPDFVANEVLVSTTNPFTLVDGDVINVALHYEAAEDQSGAGC